MKATLLKMVNLSSSNDFSIEWEGLSVSGEGDVFLVFLAGFLAGLITAIIVMCFFRKQICKFCKPPSGNHSVTLDNKGGGKVEVVYGNKITQNIYPSITPNLRDGSVNEEVKRHFDRGNDYFQKGDLDKAIAGWTEAIKLKPDLAEAYNNRGLAKDKKGDYDRAIADFDRAIQLEPDDADAYCNRGNAWDEKGKYDEAIADFNQAIKLKPDDAATYYNRGNAWRKKVKYDEAIADYDKAIKLKRDYAEAYNNRGVTRDKQGEYDEAIADVERAIELFEQQGNAEGAEVARKAFEKAKERGG